MPNAILIEEWSQLSSLEDKLIRMECQNNPEPAISNKQGGCLILPTISISLYSAALFIGHG